MLRRVRRTAAGLAAGVLVSTALVLAGPSGPAQAIPCGEYRTATTVYYNHCGTYQVEVRITYWGSPWIRWECMAPGNHRLGSDKYIARAYSKGKICN